VPTAITDQLPDRSGLIVAFDTETSGLFTDEGARPAIVTVAWGDPGAIQTRCFAFDQGVLDKPDAKGLQASFFDDAPNLSEAEWVELCQWLRRQRLMAHNVKFDLLMMRAGHRKYEQGVDLSNNVMWDTQVVCPIIFPGHPTGLKPTCERLWGETERDAERRLAQWLKKHKDARGNPRYDLAPWDLVAPYATKDVEQCLRLYHHQRSLIDEGSVGEPFELIDREIDLAICLYRMETRGVGFDVEACREAAAKLRRERDFLRLQLKREWRRDPTPAGARWWFFTKQAAEPVSWTEGKNPVPSVDQDAVRELRARNIPGAAEYEQLSNLSSALTKWYENWPELCGPDGRLRPSYHQTKADGQQGSGRGTISGRLSVERVQLQAIPHDFRLPAGVPSIRSFFKAKPDHELWEVDISQAEVRVATHCAECEPMRQVLLAGDDVHGQTAIRVFGVSPDDGDWSKWRTLAKRLTFATLYGAGPRKFRQTLKEQGDIVVPESQAREWLDDYRATFPQFVKLYRDQEYRVKRFGYVQLVTGRRRWFSDMERSFHPYKAMNQLIQCNVAEVMKIIKVEVEYEYPGLMLNEIHDSLMLEVPAGEEGMALVKLVVALMEEWLMELFGGWDKDHIIPWKVDAKPWAA